MVSIDIKRQTYTQQAIISALRVSSTDSSLSFVGYALENARAGSHYRKTPTPPGTYTAKVRTDGPLGWRIELLHVPGHAHIEMHIGNYPDDSHGCFLPGETKTSNAVGHSAAALRQIKAIVNADGSGVITVQVEGSNTAP